jgi:transposase
MGPANQHDSTRLIDVMENISDCLDDDAIKEIVQCYADKGYDAEYIREYLEKRRIQDCIPYRKDSKTEHDDAAQYKYNKTRYVVERFFAWLKNGFHRTRIRYEKNAENYLAFVVISSIMMYWRVLG